MHAGFRDVSDVRSPSQSRENARLPVSVRRKESIKKARSIARAVAPASYLVLKLIMPKSESRMIIDGKRSGEGADGVHFLHDRSRDTAAG